MLRYSRFFLVLAGVAALHSRTPGRQGAPAGRGNVPTTLPDLRAYNLKHFVRDFNRNYVPGTLEWIRRKMIFQANMQQVMSLHSVPGLSWVPGVTQYMDWTEAEWQQLMGVKGMRPAEPPRAASINNISGHSRTLVQQVPESFSVLTAATGVGDLRTVVKEQGHCGSCWAISAISALEGQMQTNTALMQELSKSHQSPRLSAQAVLSCTKNPNECGGKGGCKGATGWLAYEQIKATGVPLDEAWPYLGQVEKCEAAKLSGLRIGIKGYVTLPKNDLTSLKTALVQTGGPIIVSVAASGWRSYYAGIYSDDRSPDYIINHAVNLMGYSGPTKASQGYWLCKNSWGESFGEKGYIRLLMREGLQDNKRCGLDTDTFAGQACKNTASGAPPDPPTDTACGTCGILYHGVYPTDPYIIPAAR